MNHRVISSVLPVLILLLLSSAASAMLHPVQNRFVQRDPAGYVDGMNCYEIAASNPCDHTDWSGMYGSHTRIESGAVEVGLNGPPEQWITKSCKAVITDTMVKANNGQDHGEGKKKENLFFHYLRPYNGGQPGKAEEWDGKWKAYITAQAEEFWKELELAEKQQDDKRWSHCEKALQSQARRDHALQDFFAHAVPDKKDSRMPPYGYDPRKDGGRKGYHPASYDEPTWNPLTWDPRRPRDDEHDNWEEVAGSEPALADARRTTESELMANLPVWVRVCYCACNLRPAPPTR